MQTYSSFQFLNNLFNRSFPKIKNTRPVNDFLLIYFLKEKKVVNCLEMQSYPIRSVPTIFSHGILPSPLLPQFRVLLLVSLVQPGEVRNEG